MSVEGRQDNNSQCQFICSEQVIVAQAGYRPLSKLGAMFVVVKSGLDLGWLDLDRMRADGVQEQALGPVARIMLHDGAQPDW